MKSNRKYLASLFLVLGITAFILLHAATSAGANAPVSDAPTFSVGEPVSPVISAPLRDLVIPDPEPELAREANPIRWLGDGVGESGRDIGLDPLAGLGVNTGETPIPLVTFEGVPSISGVTPPDTNGDVGPNHYIQMTNFHFEIWDKGDPENGIPPTSLFGPVALGTFFAPLGGGCGSNFGDPFVMYDDLADRWVLTQFDLASPLGMCFAVSQTPDPLGSYFMYNITTPDFPDYPKLGVWPDAYYMTTNTGFPNQYFVHAFDRVAMLAGAPATRQSFGSLANLMLPADVDGTAPPPAGDPGIFYTFYHPSATGHPPGSERLAIYEFDVDWVTPANTTYTLVEELPLAPFNYTICGFFAGGCIQQPGTGQLLDDIAWWPMHKFQYRNFGGYASMVGNFTVDADGANHAGIRWFEVRNTGGTYTLHQEGTHFPDTDSRWMGSIAMDVDGNIALGYSVSSTTTKPSIRYATRLAGDALGTLSAEEEMWTGTGVQTGIHRWGDYSAMSVDPVDGCSFWFTSEYHDVNDTGFNWNTRVGVFRLDECGAPDFNLGVTPASQDICTPDPAVYNVDVGQIQGYTDPVTLSAQGHPGGTTANFSTNPVIPPGTSMLTIGNTGAAAAGTYSIDVIGVAPTSTHTATVELNVFTASPGAPTLVSPADDATGVPLAPSFSWNAATQGALYDLEVATDAGFTNIVYSETGIEGTSHDAASPLDPLTEYYWRVRSTNACGNGTFSAVFSFTTADIPPILLVDDDDDNPDVQSAWTDTLDTLGLLYDVWETGSSDVEPTLGTISQYETVLWFSGDRFGGPPSGPAGPSSTTESALGDWLDGGGCLFISSQDYRYDKGTVTSFMTNYLGVSNVTDDNGDYTSVTGQNVFSGLGPYALTFPYSDFTDPMTAANGGINAMLGNNGKVGGVTKDAGIYKTSWWAFGLETLSSSAQLATMQTLIDWCGVVVEVPDIELSPTSLSSQQPADTVEVEQLSIENVGEAVLDWSVDEDADVPAAAPVGGGWSDDFDSYATGTDLHGVGGWKGWQNDQTFTAFTTDDQALSAPNSVDITGLSDLVHEYSGYTSGNWVYTAWQYIPSSMTGETYFIMLNTYDDSGVGLNWSVQVIFNAAANTVSNTGASGGSATLVEDEWVEIRVEIDLDANTQDFYYDGSLLYSGTWTNEVSGGGALNIGAVDLFANNASSAYYDDLSLEQGAIPVCSAPEDIPWVSVDPDSGSTNPGNTTDVDVTFDSTGLAIGTYTGNLCVNSNDPNESLIVVPVELEVIEPIVFPIYVPIIMREP